MNKRKLNTLVNENFEVQENGFISTKKRVAVYVRYSSENQKEGYSVEYQIEECQKYIDTHNMIFVKAYIDEAVSGKTTNKRNAFFNLLNDVKKGLYDAVVVYKYSRFARNLVEATLYRQQIESSGAVLISAMEQIDDSTPEGRMMRNIILVMDEYYSDNLAVFVSSALYSAAKSGKILGGPAPLGYKYGSNGIFEIDENEAPAIRMIFEMFANGVSQADILRALDNAGYRTRKGIPFKSSTFRNILKNEKYIGTYEIEITGYEKIISENAFTPIIDKTTWNRVQLRLAEKKEKKEPRPRLKKRSYPLTGLIRCGCCGNSMVGSAKGARKDGVTTEYNYYVCKGKEDKRVCKQKNIRKEHLENWVFKEIRKNILNENIIEKLAAETYEVLAQDEPPTENELKELYNKKRKAESKLEKALEDAYEDDLPKSVRTKLTAKFTEQINAIDRQISRLEIQQASVLSVEKIKTYLREMMYKLDSSEADIQKSVVQETVKGITVTHDSIVLELYVNMENLAPAQEVEPLPTITVGGSRFNLV